jgi:endonuclease YncB( thermonuclease family)
MSFIKKYLCCVYPEKNLQTNNNQIKSIVQKLEEELVQCTTNDITEFTLGGLKTIGKVVEVYDGDTCKIVLIHENKLMKFTCRLNFIDCPEIKPLKTKINREIEIKEAMKARNRLIQLSTNCKCELNNELSKKEIVSLLKNNTKIIPIQCYEFDKYGRLLVVIFYEDSIINNILINEGFAKSYSGGTKK